MKEILGDKAEKVTLTPTPNPSPLTPHPKS